jgi:hypothetical protein
MKIKLLALTFGIFLAAGTAYAGPTPGGVDTDGDTVEDAFDNCVARANPTQVDTDHDGCGQFCDFDWNNNGVTQLGEVNLAASQFGTTCTPVGTCVCDFNQNGVCQLGEVNTISSSFGTKPGPSGITTAQCNTARCDCTPAP